MKSILISIQPQWVEKILNGEKTIEIRKTMPKCELPCKVYIYCTKAKPTLQYFYNWENYKPISEHSTWADGRTINVGEYGNGKVVAEFTLKNISYWYWQPYWTPEVMHICDISEKSCVSTEVLVQYCDNKIIYAWHIDDLKIYDNPKELSQFRKDLDCDDYPCNKNCDCKYNYYDNSEGCWACGIDFDGEHCIYKTIKRPPQSWCYVEEVGA
jgi:predicted transcriptional regulator